MRTLDTPRHRLDHRQGYWPEAPVRHARVALLGIASPRSPRQQQASVERALILGQLAVMSFALACAAIIALAMPL